MESYALNIVFDTKELAFIAALLDASTIFGIKDPFLGMSEDEIKSEWAEIQHSLIDKQFIQINQDGSITIDEVVSAVVNTCSNCEVCILLNHTASELSESRYIYVTHYLAVEVSFKSTSDTTCTFAALPTVQSIRHQIKNLLKYNKSHRNTVAKGGHVPESSLQQAKVFVAQSEMEKAIEQLKTAGLEEDTAVELLDALKTPVSNNILVAMQFEDGNRGDASGFCLLEGENNLWKLNSFIKDTESWIEIMPYDIQNLEQDIYDVIGDLASIYISGSEE